MKRHILSCIFAVISSMMAQAQSADTLSVAEPQPFIPDAGELEFFSGIDLNYRDIMMNSQYEFLINLTPGIKWHPWRHTHIAAQALIPIINQYGSYYSRPRLNVLSVSQELLLFHHLALKPSFGLFTQERWGLDLKATYPLTPWLAFEGQFGYTGLLSMAQGFHMSSINRILALAGADFYIPRWNTQFRIIGGQFLNADRGFYFEGMRHFTHCTVGVYAQYSNRATQTDGYNGGFKVIMSIPPYHRRHRTVTFRPANNFRLTYNMNADPYSNKVYFTDPEQNERNGWFSPDILPWGANRIYDYTEKEGGKK